MKAKMMLLLAALLLTVASCGKKETEYTAEHDHSSKQYTLLKKADWFLGKWENSSKPGVLSENWAKTSDSVYSGESYFVTGKDTLFAETIRLEEADGELAYVVTVPAQNEGKPVRFEMTSATANQIVFENPLHDYPNKIVYNKAGNDSLVAEISGLQKGKQASEKFILLKLK